MAYLFGWREEDLTVEVLNDTFAADFVRKYAIAGETGFLAPSDCTVERIWCGTTTAGASQFKVYLYDGPTGALLGETAEATVVDGGFFVDLLSPVSLVSGQRVGIATHSAGGTVRGRGESASYTFFLNQTADYSLGAPDPFADDSSGSGSRIVLWADGTTGASSTPTITDINTTNEVTPGEAATLTGTNLTNATGLNIGSEAQADFAVVSATSVTFTGTRGGNPYNQDLTATLLSPDGNATITVQQVSGAGEQAVTAVNPNTTDDASLATQLVDTATGNPVTVVNGDQVWARDYANLSTPEIPFTINPDFTITAGNTGTFIVQFWRQSEGVWGSDQTVSFVVPGGGVDPVDPSGDSIRSTVRDTVRDTLRSTRRTL